MKVIGKISHDVYLCQVSHTELEKCMGKYYGGLKRLEVGDECYLGAGHDYSVDIKDAMSTTQSFIEKNEKIVRAILDGLRIVKNAEQDAAKGE